MSVRARRRPQLEGERPGLLRVSSRARYRNAEGDAHRVSPTLMARLVEHGRERHAPPDGRLVRYADGRPITSRRYDHLWVRIGRHLPWVATQGISSHWIRHTNLDLGRT